MRYVTDIYVQALANDKPIGEPWRLTHDNRVVQPPVWTRDGREIVFSSNRTGRWSLWRIAVSPGAEARRIPGTDDARSVTISTGSPTRLVYERYYERISIWRKRMAGDGGEAGVPERLIASQGLEWDPQFSPDGNRIALRSDRSGFDEIVICRSDGSDPVQLTSFKGSRHAGAPRWSPDGRRIAFDSQHASGINLFVVAADGGPPQPLTEGNWSDIRASWSSDGRWVYFGSNRSGRYEIWKVPGSGGDARQVTKDGGFEAQESPDGRTLFYTKGYLAHFGEIFSHRFSHGIQAPQQTIGRLESTLATEKVHSSPVCSPAAQNLLTSSFQPRRDFRKRQVTHGRARIASGLGVS
jgi:Tol biopolymer transport system component